MLLKRNHLFIILGCLAVILILALAHYRQTAKNATSTDDSSPSLYVDFQKRHPQFEAEMARLTSTSDFRSLALYAESLIPQSTERFETAYLHYVAAYSYVNAVIQNSNDTDSLEKAIALSKDIVSDDNSYPIIKAYTLDSYDRLTFSFMKPSVSERAMKDSYFQKFSLPATTTVERQSFRKNLLQYMIDLYPVTNAYYKLALLEAQSSTTEQFFKPVTDNKLKEVKNEQLRVRFMDYIHQGDELLERDYSKQGLFHNTVNIPEALLSRTLAAQLYFLQTGEKPFGDISTLYEKALGESEKLNPSYSRVIKSWQADWVNNPKNTEK